MQKYLSIFFGVVLWLSSDFQGLNKIKEPLPQGHRWIRDGGVFFLALPLPLWPAMELQPLDITFESVSGSQALCVFVDTVNCLQTQRSLPASQLPDALGFSRSIPFLACECASFIPGERLFGLQQMNQPFPVEICPVFFPWQQPVKPLNKVPLGLE